jgi:hypothetical protein
MDLTAGRISAGVIHGADLQTMRCPGIKGRRIDLDTRASSWYLWCGRDKKTMAARLMARI